MITVRELRVSYGTGGGRVEAVRGVSLTVPDGSFYTLLGPSGCGKTSTLRAIAGLERPALGEISIGGELVFSSSAGVAIPPHRRDIGMVFQSYAIWPHMTVLDNILFPLTKGRRHLPGGEAKKLALRALDMVRLGGLAGRPATLLSGGQQQRVALARALAIEPKVLLLDEPLSNLDARLRVEMRQELKDLVSRLGITTLYVTHDQVEALSMSDRIAVMQDGLVAQEGTPRDIYFRPTSEFVAGFVGRANVLPGRLSKQRTEGGRIAVETACGVMCCELPPWELAAEEVLVVFRPESVRMEHTGASSNGANVLAGTVQSGSFIGDIIEYLVDVQGHRFTVQTDSRQALASDSSIYLLIEPERCLVVNRASLS